MCFGRSRQQISDQSNICGRNEGTNVFQSYLIRIYSPFIFQRLFVFSRFLRAVKPQQRRHRLNISSRHRRSIYFLLLFLLSRFIPVAASRRVALTGCNYMCSLPPRRRRVLPVGRRAATLPQLRLAFLPMATKKVIYVAIIFHQPHANGFPTFI